MKLNNNGWGLKEMIILCCLLLFFFIVAIYFIHAFYSSLGLQVKSDSDNVDVIIYHEMEEKLENAAEAYILENGFGYSMVSAQTLIKTGYISSLNDPASDEKCHGYVNINGDVFDGYLSCPNYVTEGYGD